MSEASDVNPDDRAVMRHWYCFTFTGNSLSGEGSAIASTYVGFERRGVTVAIIKAQKKEARVDNNDVLIACIHLGYMSREDFTGS